MRVSKGLTMARSEFVDMSPRLLPSKSTHVGCSNALPFGVPGILSRAISTASRLVAWS